MIAKSDVIILVISASTLAAGIYRWQSNMHGLSTAQSTISRPATNVVNSVPPSNTIANPAQPAVNATVANTSTTTFGNTTTNSASNDSQVVAVDTEINTVANITAANTDSSISANNPTPEPLYGVYRVKAGDYLGKIAADHGTTVQTLRSINNISGSLIDIGQEISYPLPAN